MRQPSEEEIRALEAELEKLTVDDVLLQTVVTLLNLGARKAGLAEGTTADLPQVKHGGRRRARAAARCSSPSTASSSRRCATRCRACRWPMCRNPEASSRRRRHRRSPARQAPARRRARAGSGFQGSNAVFRDNMARSSGGPARAAAFVVSKAFAGPAARFLDLEGFP